MTPTVGASRCTASWYARPVDVGVGHRQRAHPHGQPGACTSPPTRPRRWRWRCRARRRRPRWRPPRRRRARCGCGAGRRRGRRTAPRGAAAGPGAPGRRPRRARPGSCRAPTMTAEPAISRLPSPPLRSLRAPAPATAPAMPTPSRTSPSSGERRLGLPVAPTTGEDGHHVLTGGDEGRDHRGQEGAQQCRTPRRGGRATRSGRTGRARCRSSAARREQGPADADAQDDAQHRGRPRRGRALRRGSRGATASAYLRWRPSGPGSGTAGGRRPRTPGRPGAPPRAAPSPRSAR